MNTPVRRHPNNLPTQARLPRGGPFCVSPAAPPQRPTSRTPSTPPPPCRYHSSGKTQIAELAWAQGRWAGRNHDPDARQQRCATALIGWPWSVLEPVVVPDAVAADQAADRPCYPHPMTPAQQQAELLRTSERIAESRTWAAYRQVPRGMGGMDRTSPEYRRWRRQAAGHAFLLGALRVVDPYPAIYDQRNHYSP